MNTPFSSTSFDAKSTNMYISTTPSAGCLVGLIRRFFGPSHQSDHQTSDFKSKHNDTESPGPNLVARLMGLDSMPDFSSIPPHKPILRSRSMNSADHDQLQAAGQGKHRCVRTSVSFRDMPTYLYHENDEYLVLTFEDQMRTCDAEKCKDNNKKKLEAEEYKDISETEPPRRRRKKKKMRSTIQRVEAECSSEDSSPVSVLDFNIDPQFPTEEGSRSNSRRKLEPNLEKYQEQSTTTSNDEETNAKQQDSGSCRDVWGLVCRVADRDMVMQPHWSFRKGCTFEDLGHVYQDLEVQILDQLFQELVLQL